MLSFRPKGAIFDIDDTLLDNRLPAELGYGLHERSRLMAMHEVGRRYDVPELLALTPKQNLDAFLTAPVHTAEAGLWNTLVMLGLADSEVINHENIFFREALELKNKFFKDVLVSEGKELPGASDFIRALSTEFNLENRLAVASMGILADIQVFLDKYTLRDVFPDHRIVSKERVDHPKPHPEVFEKAFQMLGLNEADKPYVCAFEDDPRGIMSAKAAGLYTCAITTRFDKDMLLALEVPPDVVADSFGEFSKLFNLNS